MFTDVCVFLHLCYFLTASLSLFRTVFFFQLPAKFTLTKNIYSVSINVWKFVNKTTFWTKSWEKMHFFSQLFSSVFYWTAIKRTTSGWLLNELPEEELLAPPLPPPHFFFVLFVFGTCVVRDVKVRQITTSIRSPPTSQRALLEGFRTTPGCGGCVLEGSS